MTKDRTTADASVTSPGATDERHGAIGAGEYLPPIYSASKAGLSDMRTAPTSYSDLGTRAAKLRTERDMTIAELAQRAGVTGADIEAFERGDMTSVSIMLAVHQVLSGDAALEQLFSTPRFETIEDVVAYEARRRSA